jgi:hypothetical protein
MIMRVKFKTIPGEQFVVRREVFRMMQEAFHENGIEFAHRNVTVYLPVFYPQSIAANKIQWMNFLCPFVFENPQIALKAAQSPDAF